MLRTGKLKVEQYNEFIECIQDLLDHPVVQSMDNFIQHSDVTTLEHCKNVAYYNFLLCRKLGLDARSAARGGLLHDLFLYDWHDQHDIKGVHAIRHPKIALEHANEHFDLNPIEQDIIRMHMWPVANGVPRFAETMCICFVDKYCACLEVARVSHRLTRRRHSKIELAMAWE